MTNSNNQLTTKNDRQIKISNFLKKSDSSSLTMAGISTRLIGGQILHGILLLSIALDQICTQGEAAPMAPPAAAAAAASSQSNSYGTGGVLLKNPMAISNGHLLMEKRQMAFMPSRGKKQSSQFADIERETNSNDGSYDNSFGNEFSMNSNNQNGAMIDKRTSGFLPMRGRKSYYDSGAVEGNAVDDAINSDGISLSDLSSAVDELRQLPLSAKRVSAFMPMRGRKWDGGQPEQFPTGYYYYYPGQSVGQTMKWNPVSDFNLDQQTSEMEKRKGVAFFGSRGKRSVNALIR